MRPTIFLFLAIMFAGATLPGAEPSAEDIAFFEKQVQPILAAHCFECHSHAKKIKGALALDSRSGWAAGGESGEPAVVPGKPDDSPLIQAVKRVGLEMPPDKPLPANEIAVLVEWVKRGAVDPRKDVARIGGMTEDEAKNWWAFQPLPVTRIDAAGIDSLINVQAGEAKVKLAAAADKRTLLRRVYYDLTGLPPSSAATTAFLADQSPDAFTRVVNALLESPQYGEKWARHWLDVVRYADSFDSRGIGGEGDIGEAWRYRDWVVGAFIRDLPFDQFIKQQVAGDILAADKEPFDPAPLTATGMFAIGNWGNGDADKEKLYTDMVDDQIDVVGRGFLGLTLACARCHDHKFDAITAKDYYGLAGIFFSSRIVARFAAKTAGENPIRIPLQSPQEIARRDAMKKRIAEIDSRLAESPRPITELRGKLSGIDGLFNRYGKDFELPSLTINTTDRELAFTTIKLPPKSFSMHPGPKIPVVVAWQSPVAGKIRISGELNDADPNCGDGITWALRLGTETIASGEMNNGGRAVIAEVTATVTRGDAVRLVVGPRGEYTCDSTRVDLVVQDEAGKSWSLREAVLKDTDKPAADGIVDEVWKLQAGEGLDRGVQAEEFAKLEAERKKLAADAAPTEFVHGLQEGGIPDTPYTGFSDARVHLRGSYTRLSDKVPRRFPLVLAGEQQLPIPTGSGRRELANWLTDPKNPLPARVFVNRLWQHHFGEGIVRTPNNFGKLGTPPTHPQLLDRLAAEFIASGWSVKHLHRLILSTAAYQRSSTPADVAQDPGNQLFARQNRRRLSAEELRDSLLVAAGKLDPKLGGPSVRDLNKPRRTLYITTIRSDKGTYRDLFDGADANGIVEKRTDTVVAPQSLWLLNHPFSLAQAETTAKAVVAAPGDVAAKTQSLFQRLLQRSASEQELDLARRAVTDPNDVRQWEAFCRVIYCSNEFAYVD